jgi:hypothetical protein
MYVPAAIPRLNDCYLLHHLFSGCDYSSDHHLLSTACHNYFRSKNISFHCLPENKIYFAGTSMIVKVGFVANRNLNKMWNISVMKLYTVIFRKASVENKYLEIVEISIS